MAANWDELTDSSDPSRKMMRSSALALPGSLELRDKPCLLARSPAPLPSTPSRKCEGRKSWAEINPELLEPISKSSEEDNEAGELDKAEEVLSVVLPADEYATLPLYPGEEALDEPAPLVTA